MTRARRSASPPGYRGLACRSLNAISTTSSGRTYTVQPIAARSRARSSSSRLPLEHLVGQPLERLAEHHVLAGGRIERAEVQVRELAGAPAVAPFRREHDEIERVRALDLEPARAAIAGFVGRIERLRHHAFVAGRDAPSS